MSIIAASWAVVRPDQCPSWVNRVILARCRSLPVYSQLRTWRCAITDAMCQSTTSNCYWPSETAAIQGPRCRN
jgi:hypothetical protein